MSRVDDETFRALQAGAAELGMNRRGFFKLAAVVGGGLVVGTSLPAAAENEAEDGDGGELNTFVHIATDGTITIYSPSPEMGQGIKTALPMIIAEELGARWEDVKVVTAPIDASSFGQQGAGGSTTIPREWNRMRQLGASAREMLIGAGALVMELPPEELVAVDSMVRHDSGRFMTFGQLATLAAKQPVPDPDGLVFKSRDEYTILGKSMTGVDNLEIATGAALFGIDTRVPDMLYAAYQKCPAIGGRIRSANVDEIKALPGIVDAFTLRGNGNPRQLLDGVAVVGTSTWAVFEARKQLEIEWDERRASKDSWTQIKTRAESLAGQRGRKVTLDKGSVDDVFADTANTTREAFYEIPFVAHLCMEPMNCTAHYRSGERGGDSIEVWLPHQSPGASIPLLSRNFNVDEERITVHQTRIGGSFGRRLFGEYVMEAVTISKRVNAPVKLTWSREDDMRHDFFRPGGFQSVKGAVDPSGRLVGFENHFIGMQTGGRPVNGAFFRRREFPLPIIDDGFVSRTMFGINTPCGPWRAPGSNTNAFVVQSFLDEMAHAAGRDYVEFLLEILGEPRWLVPGNIRTMHTGRAADVIRLAAERSGWGRELPAGRGLGLAFYFCHAAHVAEVAEVSVDANKKLTVHKVTAAVDVGPIVNMSGALSQVEGSIIDGLSTMVGQKITMEEGRVQQTNFHQYPVLRIPAAPPVDVHFIQSEYAPTGLGEPALPPLAPAVGNAIFAATGERVRKMPLTDLGYSV